MSDPNYPIEWRPTGSLRKRRFYARYLKLLMRFGYSFVLTAFIALGVAFIVQTDQVIATIPDALATITGRRTIVNTEGPAMVMEVLAANGDMVQEGDPLLMVAEGEELALALARQQLQDLGTPAAIRALEQMPMVEARLVTAPQAGEFRGVAPGSVLAPGQELLRVTDYSEIVVESRLRGDSVPDARSGQSARVTQIAPDRVASTLVRVSVPGATAASGSVLGADLLDALEATVQDKPFRVRNDLEFRGVGLGAVEVEVRGDARDVTSESPGVPVFDPSREASFVAMVESGKHYALIQTADTTPEQRALALQEVQRQLEGRAFAYFTEEELRRVALAEIDPQLNLILQVRTEISAADARESERGDRVSTVDRYFDAVMTIPSPPPGLVELIRVTERDGRAVRARVELVTGQRPFALQLLRR